MGITLRKIFLFSLVIILFLIPSSKLPLDPIEKITLDHSFSLINWEIKNLEFQIVQENPMKNVENE